MENQEMPVIHHAYKIRSVLLLLVAALSVWLFVMVAQRYVLRPRADQNSVATQFNPASLTVEVGQTANAQMAVTTVDPSKITGLDVVFAITGPVKLTQTESLSSSAPNATITNLLKSDTRFSYTITGDRNDLPSAVTMPLGIECTGPGQATIELDKERSGFLGTITGGVFGVNVENTLTVNCGGAGTLGVGAPAKAKFEPATQSAEVGEQLTYRLMIMPDGQTGISAFNFSLKFDPRLVEVAEVGEPVAMASGGNSTALGASCTVDADCPSPCADPTQPGCQLVCVSGQCQMSSASNPGTNPGGSTKPIPTTVSSGPAPVNTGTPSGGCTVDADCPSPCADPTQPGCGMSCVSGACRPSTGTNQPTPTSDPNATPNPTGGAGESQFKKIINVYDNVAGTIDLAYMIEGASVSLPRGVGIPIVLRGKAEGSGKLEFTKSEMTGDVADSDYDVVTTAGEYKVGTQSGGDEVAVNLIMKIRLQGVTSLPTRTQTIPVKVTLTDGLLSEPVEQTATFTADENGVWSGTVPFTVPDGDGFKVLVKPPYNMQKRVCDNAPTETEGGNYDCARGAITLVEGDNVLDFSGIGIYVGDLPTQDGIVNSNDITLARENIGKTDAESLAICDVDFNNVCNSIDYALVASLKIRHDEK